MTTASNHKLSICFVAHNAYGALAGVDTGHTGGIECQQALMARALVARGHEVSMVTLDEGQAADTVVDGVRVIKMCRREAGMKVVRFFHPKWTSLNRALRQANADVYYYNCGDLALGQVAMWCRWNGRACVYSVASEPDCDPALPVLKQWRERVLYRYGLRHASSIIVQTRRQQQLLREGFGLDSVLIPMACTVPPDDALASMPTPSNEPPRVLWVGRFSYPKRLEWLLEIAEQSPQWQFDVVGAANTATAESRALVEHAGRLPNVTLHGRIKHADMSEYYQRATVLCCTSAYEGFPNTFLEAWGHGLPIVSSFDPDGLIAERELGRISTTIPELRAELETVLGSRELLQRYGQNGRRYCRQTHAVEVVLSRFEEVFADVAAGAVRPRPVTSEA